MLLLLMFIGTRASLAANNEAEYALLQEAKCRDIEMLVELPIPQETFYKLSTTHAYVRRCLGVNDEKKACVSKDRTVKTEHWSIIKTTGSQKKEFIHVSWVSHEKCGYQRRKKCPIDMSQKCHKKSTTHYYDEVNCTCDCIVQINGKDTCFDKTKIENASSMIIWLPILTFALGIFTIATFIYFKTCQRQSFDQVNKFNDPDNESSPVIGFTDVEQPAEPPTPTLAGDETMTKNKIGFIH